MHKPNLQFAILAALSSSLVSCSIHSNDSGSAPPAEDGLSNTASSTSGVEGSAGGSVGTSSGTASTSVGGPPLTTNGSTSGSGGSPNNATPSTNSGTGGTGSLAGTAGAGNDADPPVAAAGAAGDTGDAVSKDDPAASAPALMLTEYVEGSSNNKAIEITNLGSEPRDTSTCTLQMFFNGSTDPRTKIPLPATMDPGQSWVTCHSKSAEAVLERCDLESSSIGFNGDDAIVVICGNEVVDAFGQLGKAPAEGHWGAADTVTEDQTLRRICSSSPRTDPSQPFVPEEYFESAGEGQPDVFDDLGSYACD